MSKPRSIHQRYQREFWPVMAAYILIMFLLWPLLPQVHSEWLKIGLALLPVVPVLLVVRAMVRLVLGSDELEQRIHLIGLAIAATVVSALSLAGGISGGGGGHPSGWQHSDLGVADAGGAVRGGARLGASRRYGGQGDGLCDSGGAMHWRLLFVALVLAAIAWVGHGRMSDDQFGMLLGMDTSLGVGALVKLALRWRQTTRHVR